MPGAGKSTIGVVLAKAANLGFLDTDVLLQERERRTLQQILEEEGFEGFCAAEERLILSLERRRCVIATGGSVVYSEAAMRRLASEGWIVYLQTPLEEIEKRVRNWSSRGVVMRPGGTLASLYKERAPLYERWADETIACAGRDLEEIVHAAVETLPLRREE
jgi:shikimate kinase